MKYSILVSCLALVLFTSCSQTDSVKNNTDCSYAVLKIYSNTNYYNNNDDYYNQLKNDDSIAGILVWNDNGGLYRRDFTAPELKKLYSDKVGNIDVFPTDEATTMNFYFMNIIYKDSVSVIDIYIVEPSYSQVSDVLNSIILQSSNDTDKYKLSD